MAGFSIHGQFDGNDSTLFIKKGRAQIDSITQTETQFSVNEGTAFNINTGLIATVNSDTALLYFKNNQNQTAVIDAIAVGVGNVSVAGTD